MSHDRDARPYWADNADAFDAGVHRLEGDRKCDIAVIGGGYTGLAAARYLARRYEADVVVLEARTVGWGASGRNAGMVVPTVGKVSLDRQAALWGPDAARGSVRLGVDAVARLREILQDERIDCDVQPDGWVLVAHRPEAVHRLETLRDRYASLGLRGIEFLGPSTLAAEGVLQSPQMFGGLRFPSSFGLHPGKLVHGLAVAARRAKAVVFENTEVVRWDRRPEAHTLFTAGGRVTAKKVLIATDGYTPNRLHPALHGRLAALSSHILVTRPLDKTELDNSGLGGYHVFTDSRRLLFYWRRLPDDRVLFGGPGPVVRNHHALRRRRWWLHARLGEILPALRDVPIDYYWYGNVGFSRDRMPHVASLEADVACAAGYAGTGIALAVFLGELAAERLMRILPALGPAVIDRSFPRYPLAGLRQAYVAGGRAVYGFLDRA